MTRRTLCILMALALCVALAGCTTPAATDNATASPTAAQTTAAATATPAASDAADPAQTAQTPSDEGERQRSEEDPNFFLTGYPIVEEKVNLTGFGNQNVTHADWNEAWCFQQLEEITNVHIDWETAPNSGFSEAKSIMLASGDYPDIFLRCSLTVSELSTYGQMGVFADLTEYLEKYAYNFNALCEEYSDILKQITTPDGIIYSMPLVQPYEAANKFAKNWINSVWLDRVGMDVPNTTDEFFDVLRAFKEQDANGNGDPSDEIPYSDRDSGNSLFTSTYGSFGIGTLGSNLFSAYIDRDENNNLRFFATSEEFKTQMKWIRDMYAEGLIDPEMYTQDIASFTAKNSTDLIGACFQNATLSMFSPEVADQFIAIRVLEGPNGDRMLTNVPPLVTAVGAFAVSAESEYIKEAVRWCDYLFTVEGEMIFRVGPEGICYEWSEEEQRNVLTEYLTNNPDGMTINQAQGQYAISRAGGGCPGFTFVEVENIVFTQTDIDNSELMSQDIPDDLVCALFTFTIDEQDELNALSTDIQTYVSETMVAFVTGKTDIDTQWDSYVKTLEQMGLEQYMQIYSQAWERYQAS